MRLQQPRHSLTFGGRDLPFADSFKHRSNSSQGVLRALQGWQIKRDDPFTSDWYQATYTKLQGGSVALHGHVDAFLGYCRSLVLQ